MKLDNVDHLQLDPPISEQTVFINPLHDAKLSCHFHLLNTPRRLSFLHYHNTSITLVITATTVHFTLTVLFAVIFTWYITVIVFNILKINNQHCGFSSAIPALLAVLYKVAQGLKCGRVARVRAF